MTLKAPYIPNVKGLLDSSKFMYITLIHIFSGGVQPLEAPSISDKGDVDTSWALEF